MASEVSGGSVMPIGGGVRMPVECVLLDGAPSSVDICPVCGADPFDHFLRGQVQSRWRRLFRRPYCAVICWSCKEVVGWESPP